MADAPPPIEWVPGSSTLPWGLGFSVVLLATIGGGDLLVGTVVRTVGPPSVLSLVESLAILVPIVFTGTFLWVLLVPGPIAMLGISPAGIVLRHGMRDLQLPWSQTLVSGDVLYVAPRRRGLVAPYRVTPYQALRLRALRPV